MNAAEPDPDVAIACSLTADEAADRTVDFHTLFAGRHLVYQRDAGSMWLWLNNGPGVAPSIAQLLANEKECCPFFTFAVVDESPRMRVHLRVPENAERWLDWIEGMAKEATP